MTENVYDPCRIKVLSQSTFTLWLKKLKSSQTYTVLCLCFTPFPEVQSEVFQPARGVAVARISSIASTCSAAEKGLGRA